MLTQERIGHSNRQAPPTPTSGRTATSRLTPGGGSSASPSCPRLRALDALRGLAIVVMLLVMNPAPKDDLPAQLHHADWHGLTVADVAFPLFLFVVGTSMALSPRGLERRHVVYRAGVLATLGVGLASLKHEAPTATGVLQHIAGAYLLAFVVLRAPRRYQAPIAVGMLVLAWAAFTAWAGPNGEPWGETGTLAHAVDGQLLGGFTAEGILQTGISSVNVLGGAWAGRMILKVRDRPALIRTMAQRAVALVALGLALSLVVPIGKRLWTPSYTVVTLGLSFALLAAGIWFVDVRRSHRVTAPLVHLGANPMVIYLLSMSVLFTMQNHDLDATSSVALVDSHMVGALAMAVGWVWLWWLAAVALYRRETFIKL